MGKRDDTIFWALVCCLLWSTVYASIKIGLQYDTPLHFAGIRFIISGLILVPFTVKPAIFLSMAREYWKIILLTMLLQVVTNYVLFYFGLDLVPGALAAVIVGSQPLFTALIAAVMHEGDRLTTRKTITIISGIAGVILISTGRQVFRLGSAIEIFGVLMILGANIATATSNVLVSLKSRGLNPVMLNAVSLFSGGIILYLLSVILENPPADPKPADYWLVLLWLCIVASVAFSIWYRLLQRPQVKVSELNLWKFIIPIVGAVISWVSVPGENPEILTITGMVIITGSLIFFYKNSKKPVPDKK